MKLKVACCRMRATDSQMSLTMRAVSTGRYSACSGHGSIGRSQRGGCMKIVPFIVYERILSRSQSGPRVHFEDKVSRNKLKTSIQNTPTRIIKCLPKNDKIVEMQLKI